MSNTSRKRSEAAKKTAKTKAAMQHGRQQWEQRQNADRPEKAERHSVTRYLCGCLLEGNEPPSQPLSCPVHDEIWVGKGPSRAWVGISS